MPNKTTLRPHLFLDIIAIIKTAEHGEETGPWAPYSLLEGMQSGATGMEFSMDISHELKLELPDDPAMPLLGEYQKGSNFCQRDTCTPLCCCSVHATATKGNQPTCPTMEQWINSPQKEWMGGVEVMEKTGGEEGGETEIGIKISENFQLIKN